MKEEFDGLRHAEKEHVVTKKTCQLSWKETNNKCQIYTAATFRHKMQALCDEGFYCMHLSFTSISSAAEP